MEIVCREFPKFMGLNMHKIIFPRNIQRQFPRPHYDYVFTIFRSLECDIKFEIRNEFAIDLDGKRFYIDYSDFKKLDTEQKPLFKFHYRGRRKNVFAFPPISFNNWRLYNRLKDNIKYKAEGHISSRQKKDYKIYHIMREKIQQFLSDTFKNVQTEIIPNRVKYWNEINNCSVAVFVPGATNNMLDRAQWQYMAFGCCTISPRLPEILPFNKKIISDVHYIKCKDDYSDLKEKVEGCQENPKKCIEIGKNAQKLFLDTCTPEKILKWMEKCLK